MRIDNTRTAQEQKVANLFRLLGFNLKTDYRPLKREFDVFAILGPLTIAVECKDYSEADIGKGNIEEFSKKLREVRNLLGVFVANRFTSTERQLCDRLGIAHWTTLEVEDTMKKLRAEQRKHKLIPIGVGVWNLLSALKTFISFWYDYIEDWVVQHEIPDTPLFEGSGLIEVKRVEGEFSYTKTEAGEDFFSQLHRLRVLLSGDAIGEWPDRCEAASIIENACSWDNITAPDGPWDRIILASLDIYQLDDFQLTSFGRCLQVIATQIGASCNSPGSAA